MLILTTERLHLRRLTLDDAPFILRLANEPSWLRFIGDKFVRSLDLRGDGGKTLLFAMDL